MPRPDIDQIRALGDFATLYQFNVYLTTAPRAVDSPPTEDLNLRCLTSELPKAAGTSIEVHIRGHKIKQPGQYDPTHTLTMTFVETVDAKISQFLKNWREACWQTKTGRQEKKEDVEAVITLVQLNRQDEPIWQYKLTGCYIEDYDPTGAGWDGTSTEVVRPSLTLSYDYFEDEPVSGTAAAE
jgi:hypothetical protein